DLITYDTQLFTNYRISDRATIKLRLTNVNQQVESIDPSSSGTLKKQDHFTLIDASVVYGLWRRKGSISLLVKNAFNSHFNYQDLNFLTSEPRLPPFVPE